MVITSLRLRCFRNYEELTMTPGPGVNILYGENGSGKTNIIEAIHYCALGKSHRTNQDKEVVTRECPQGACGVILEKAITKEDIAIKLTPHEAKKKHVYIDKKKAQRISSLMGHLQCVIFSPEDLMLIKEGPSLRRRYMDMMISQLQPLYFVELQKYQKAMEQRNVLLKEMKKGAHTQADMIDVFEEEMARSCQVIVPMRYEMIEKVQEIAADTYREISGRKEENFSIKYMSCVKREDNIEEKTVEMLKKGREEDVFRGMTSFGPHREDIQMILNQKEMKLFASQGQIRTAALSLKLSQIDLFKKETGENPVLLLDDVLSELDMGRRTRLLERIAPVQTFITCTDESDIHFTDDARVVQISINEKNQGCATITQEGKIEEHSGEETIDDPDFS